MQMDVEAEEDGASPDEPASAYIWKFQYYFNWCKEGCMRTANLSWMEKLARRAQSSPARLPRVGQDNLAAVTWQPQVQDAGSRTKLTYNHVAELMYGSALELASRPTEKWAEACEA
jgi:hypothetical protein